MRTLARCIEARARQAVSQRSSSAGAGVYAASSAAGDSALLFFLATCAAEDAAAPPLALGAPEVVPLRVGAAGRAAATSVRRASDS